MRHGVRLDLAFVQALQERPGIRAGHDAIAIQITIHRETA
jgi:hypothetical protein